MAEMLRCALEIVPKMMSKLPHGNPVAAVPAGHPAEAGPAVRAVRSRVAGPTQPTVSAAIAVSARAAGVARRTVPSVEPRST